MIPIKFGRVDNAFSSPIFHYSLDEDGTLIQRLEAEAKDWMAEDPSGVHLTNFGKNWHSKAEIFRKKTKGFQELCKIITQVAVDVAKKIDAGFEPDNFQLRLQGWVNLSTRSGYNAYHRHSGFHLSGVFYVKQPAAVDKTSGVIEFLNSRNDEKMRSVFNSQAFHTKIAFKPKPGSMIVFPSSLMHGVYPNETDDERITVAWNVEFLPK